MDWSKLDAALAAAMAEEGGSQRLDIFVHLDPGAADRQVLARFDVRGADAGEVCTATLSPTQVDELSSLPWVRRLRLSSRLRLAGES